MKYYKDNENNVHAIDEGFEYLLPEGSVEITKEELDAIANPPPTPEQNIAAIKAKALKIIIARLPEYKQRNYLARKAELQDKLIAGGTLTPSEQTEWDFFAAEWMWVKAVRAASDAAEAAGIPVDEIVWPT